MADVKWIKITTDIFDDDKILLIESLPDADSIIVIWFKLLCLAGKQNNSGVFMMNNKIAYTDQMLATIFRRKETTVRLALQTFEEFGMVELIDGVITIPNWEKHQNLDKLDKIKEQSRLRVAKHREKQKVLSSNVTCNVTDSVTVTQCNAIDKIRKEEKRKEENNNINNHPADSYSSEFEKLWELYPRKEGKKSAFASYKRAKKNGVSFEEIESGILNYLEYIKIKKIGAKYIKQGSTWFNGECWNDEYDLTEQKEIIKPNETKSEYNSFMAQLAAMRE